MIKECYIFRKNKQTGCDRLLFFTLLSISLSFCFLCLLPQIKKCQTPSSRQYNVLLCNFSLFFSVSSVISLNSEKTPAVLEMHTFFANSADFLFCNTSLVHLRHATLVLCRDKFQLQLEPN